MRIFRPRVLLAALAALSLVGVACASKSSTTSAASGGVCASVDTTSSDALAKVCSTGELRVATDQKYKPQSWFDVKDQQWMGFDVDVANEIAKRLGVTANIQASGVGHHHGRFVERPLGRERGLDDRHRSLVSGSSPSRPPTTSRPRGSP